MGWSSRARRHDRAHPVALGGALAGWASRWRRAGALGCMALLMAGCAGGAEGGTTTTSSLPVGGNSTTFATPTGAGGQPTEGRYDVGGHRIFMRCVGSGGPTVVYLHGWIDSSGIVPFANGEIIARQLPDHRVCVYDRRNVGRSDTVDAVQTPADMLHDLEGVLAAGGAEPPYILMAASFGGLLAYSFLNEHPDDVVGMVLLDAMFPDELRLDRYLEPKDRFAGYDKADACCSMERISQYALVRSLQKYIGKEPAVPVIYLAAQQEPRTVNDYDSPEYDKRVTPALEAYVDRFSPGKLVWVDSPHFMEPAVPEVVARAVRDVAALAKKT